MEFEYLTAKEFEELTEKQQQRYLKEKRDYEAGVAKKNAEDAAKTAIDEMRKEFENSQKELLDKLKKENQEALEEQAKANKLKIEEMEAALKLNKIADINNRLKGFSEHIIEKLSTDEGVEMIKGFFAGQREKLNFEVDAATIGKAISVPANSVAPEFIPIVGPGHDDIHARNAIPVFPTIAEIVKFVQFTYTGATAGFATVDVGAQKPTLLYTSALKEAPVRKIAGLLDVPDEIMDDVVGFRAWIAYELPKAYLDAEDLQIFKGSGTGTDILGLWTQASAQTLPFGTVTTASNMWDKLMAAITQIRTLKRSTSAAFVSPQVYMELWINKGTTKEYTYPIVMGENGVLYVGGVPIYWSNVFSGVDGLVGDFARGASIHQRMAMRIDYSSENKNNFELNLVTIRLEGRIALAIRVPEAFLRLTPFTT
jgi:HK97 family phage major capsid protein